MFTDSTITPLIGDKQGATHRVDINQRIAGAYRFAETVWVYPGEEAGTLIIVDGVDRVHTVNGSPSSEDTLGALVEEWWQDRQVELAEEYDEHMAY